MARTEQERRGHRRLREHAADGHDGRRDGRYDGRNDGRGNWQGRDNDGRRWTNNDRSGQGQRSGYVNRDRPSYDGRRDGSQYRDGVRTVRTDGAVRNVSPTRTVAPRYAMDAGTGRMSGGRGTVWTTATCPT